jgi:hypothetical protein
MINCPYCGKENQIESNFCENCGKKLDSLDTDEKKGKKPPNYLIALGYILGFLGIFSLGILSIAGLIIGIIIYRNPRGKTHGLLISIISIALILMVVIIVLLSLYIYRTHIYSV